MSDQEAFDIEKFSKYDSLTEAVRTLMLHKYNSTPRHLQVALGPSEIGEPCTRKLAMNMGNRQRLNYSDPLPSIIGTAAHSWMEEACKEYNAAVGQEIYIPESEVYVTPALKGHSDCYYVPEKTVIDWKFPGKTSFQKYTTQGPSEQYIVQAHSYGKGYKNAGLEVEKVAIAFIPRAGRFQDMKIWRKPFDESIADRALKRYEEVLTLVTELNMMENDDLYFTLPTETSHACSYCPWFKPEDPRGCKGYQQ